MSETWYRTGGISSGYILPVQVERFTDHFVFVDEGISLRRFGRITTYECYFPTFNDAADHLLDEFVRKTNGAHRLYMVQQDKLTKFTEWLAEIAKEDEND